MILLGFALLSYVSIIFISDFLFAFGGILSLSLLTEEQSIS